MGSSLDTEAPLTLLLLHLPYRLGSEVRRWSSVFEVRQLARGHEGFDPALSDCVVSLCSRLCPDLLFKDTRRLLPKLCCDGSDLECEKLFCNEGALWEVLGRGEAA